MRRLFLASSFLLLTIPVPEVFAHAEHGKKRYVSSEGVDTGNCDNALRPCASMAYAVQRSNKGDKVLVSSGQYQINNSEEIFYLTSDIVPITAGYNKFDHFQNQSPNINRTFLTGVPREFVDQLSKKGFTIVNDGKSFQQDSKLKEKLSKIAALKQSQAEEPCVNGSAAGFECSNIDLVAHMPLNAFSPSHSAGSDIWGHVDLNTGTEYALMGLRSGMAVVDLSDPANPSQVGQIGGSASTWRDIKVYQYFDRDSFRWKAYAYVTVDSAADGLAIVDLNDLPNSISLVERNRSSQSAHNVYISNIDHTLNIGLQGVTPKLQLVGDRGNFNGSFHSYSLSDPATVSQESSQPASNGYTHDGASFVLRDSRANTGCVNGVNQTCTVFVDFNETEMSLWDITDPSDSRLLSTRTYNDVSNNNKYVHSGWVTEDGKYVLIHDEFDESRGGLNSTVRLFNIVNLASPVQVGQWTGPTRAIDHNGFVRGNRHYMSNYERGLTILNIDNPANPVEVGFFDTFPSSNNASFNGAWGVYPYLPSGLILVSDINSGLYILRDNTQNTTQGSLKFTTDSFSMDRGTTANIEVSRVDATNSATTVSVSYEVIPGSATDEDYVLSTGTLTWNGNDASNKSFEVELVADPGNQQFREVFFVRLFDPRSGATLTSPSYIKVTANGISNAGAVEFSSTAQSGNESAGNINVSVNRAGGSAGAATVDYTLVNGTATAGSDFTADSGTLSWVDGEIGAKVIQVAITNDTDNEADETFSVELSGATGASLGANTSIVVTLLDDDSNTAPEVTVDNDFEANQGQTVELVGSATDAQNDDLSYQWRQTAGSTMTLSNSDEPTASFVASAPGIFTFELTVTDSRGGASSSSVTVTVIQATPPSPPASSSGGGSLGFILIAGLALLTRRKFD